MRVSTIKKMRDSALRTLFSRQRNGVWPDVDPDAMGIITGARAGLHLLCEKWIVKNQKEDGGWDEIDPYYTIPQLRTLLTLQSMNTAKICKLKIDYSAALTFVETTVKHYHEKNSFMKSRWRPVLMKMISEMKLAEKLGTSIPRDKIEKAVFRDPFRKFMMMRLVETKIRDVENRPTYENVGACTIFDFEALRGNQGFVEKGQLPNGSWSGFVDTTTLMIQLYGDTPATRRAMRWMRVIGKFPPHFFPFDIFNTVFAYYYFEKVGLKAPTKQTLVWLKRAQQPNGGLGWSVEIPFPDLDDTALSAYLFRRYGERERYQKAIDFILSYEHPNGGFPLYPYSNREVNTDITSRVIECLDEKKHQHTIEKIIRYLRKTQNGDGSFEGVWNLSPLHTTSHVLLSLKKFDEDHITEKALDYIFATQQEDGGWGTPEETAYATMALRCYKTGEDRIEKALCYLNNKYKEDRWKNKKMWVGVGLYSTQAQTLAPIIAALHSLVI